MSFRRAKTPTVLQMEMTECGAASLAIILAHYGRFEPLEKLRVDCGVSRDGSNAFHLLQAAEKYGLVAKGFKKDIPALRKTKPPFIIFWQFNHFLVVEGFGRNGVYLNDPATGPRTVDLEEFDDSYTGIALTFKPGPAFQRGGSKPGLWNAIRSRMTGSWGAACFVALVSLLLVIPGLALPAFSRIYIDHYLLDGMKDWLSPILLGVAIAILVRIVLTWLQEYFLLRFETKLATTSSAKFLWHILQLPVEFYAQRYAGEIGDRVRFNSSIAKVLAGRVVTPLLDAFLAVFYGMVLLLLSPVLTLLALLTTLINVLVARWMHRGMTDGNLRLQQEKGKLVGMEMAGLANIETLKAMGGESDFFSDWAGHHAKATIAYQALELRARLFSLIPSLLARLTDAAVLGMGAFLILRSQLTMGSYVAFVALLSSFSSPIQRLMNLAMQIQQMKGELARLDDVLHHSTDPRLAASPTLTQFREKLTGHLELRNVTFGYSRLDEPLLRDFSMSVRPGCRVALVGPSGSGKSTLAKLITGLYEPWQGEVLFDNMPVTEIPRESITSSIAFVDQDITLFSGTVRDNLTLWNRTIPEADMIRACRDATIHDEIMVRPGGHDALLEEGGSNLSGGQRQRLEIARALANNPRILVLDEATSALDTVTELEIDRHLRARGCMCVIIAHRLSTIRDADEIIVLDRGQVVQRGTHGTLMEDKQGLYARLISEL